MGNNAPQTSMQTDPVFNYADTEGILGEALRDFDSIWISQQSERAQALEDRRFAFITGAQWEGDWGALFENSIKVEINKAAQGLEDIIDQYKANRISVNFRSVGPSQKGDAASTLNGMFLADYYLSKGQQATDNAFIEAAAGGYGAFRLTNVYCDEQDEDNDQQKIIFQAIVDADQSVFWDPNAKLYDKSDAAFCFVLTNISKQAFKSSYGDEVQAEWPKLFVKPYYDWYKPDVVTIAEYYRLQYVKDTVYKFVNKLNPTQKQSVYASDEDYKAIIKNLKITGWDLVSTKKIKRKECRKWILSGQDILNDEGEEGMLIAGGMIPIIPVYGRRMFIDNLERAKGHIRLAKDPQRVYNVQISKLTETAALAPIERPIFTPEQVEGHEDSWAEANITRAPYALINPVIDEASGDKRPLGPIGKLEPPQLSPVLAALIQQTNADIKELTDSDDGAGQVKANVSADAMQIAAERTDDKATLYIDNMTQSMQRAGEVYLAMARDIYFEEGREVTTLTFDKNQKEQYGTAIINERVADSNGIQVIKNQIGKGQFNVIADVAEQTKVKRDKTVKSLYNALQIIMPVDQSLGSIIASTMFMNMDGDGIEDLQTYVRGQLLISGAAQPTDDEKEELAKQQQIQSQQPPSPEEQLAIAAAHNQEALAMKAQAEAKEAGTKAVVNLANAGKLQAETGQKKVDTIKTMQTPIEQKSDNSQSNQPVATNSNPSKLKSILHRFVNIGRR